jgi:DNA-binding CsgD family transcriptional regulator
MLVEEGFESEFDAALEGHASPFERARTQLRLGARLRRERRPTDARFPLRSAQEAFELLGASGWAAQATAELAAAGERPKRRQASSSPLLHDLTDQELRIALLVAEGVTNREAAATLFLSPKTVGYHLGKVYEKLGVRSRTELARLIARA